MIDIEESGRNKKGRSLLMGMYDKKKEKEKERVENQRE